MTRAYRKASRWFWDHVHHVGGTALGWWHVAGHHVVDRRHGLGGGTGMSLLFVGLLAGFLLGFAVGFHLMTKILEDNDGTDD